MSKKLYIPVALRRASEEAAKLETMKYKIVRRPGYRYSLELK